MGEDGRGSVRTVHTSVPSGPPVYTPPGSRRVGRPSVVVVTEVLSEGLVTGGSTGTSAGTPDLPELRVGTERFGSGDVVVCGQYRLGGTSRVVLRTCTYTRKHVSHDTQHSHTHIHPHLASHILDEVTEPPTSLRSRHTETLIPFLPPAPGKREVGTLWSKSVVSCPFLSLPPKGG